MSECVTRLRRAGMFGLEEMRHVSGLMIGGYVSVVRDQFLASYGEVPFDTIVRFFLQGVPPLEAVELIAAGV
jgi:hypothetical protein